MMAEFEVQVTERYEEMEAWEKAYFSLKFNRQEGDVKCVAHIYNIAIQKGMDL
jgi:hypothetical protein